MRGLKAAILLAGFAILAWTALNLFLEATSIYPAWKWWHAGAAGACLYVFFDLLDCWREFLGWRTGAPRRRYYGWGRRYE